MAVRAQKLTVHSPPFGDKPLQVQISLPERVLWPRFNARIYVPERWKNAWGIVRIIISNDPPLYMAVRAQQLTVHSPPFGD